jgi:rRNA maturation endonuclease Nob1
VTPTMKRETAGRCAGCKTIWKWSGALLLRDATCPVCGAKLARTATALVKNKRVIKTARCTDRGLRLIR